MKRRSNDEADIASTWILSQQIRPLDHELVGDRVQQLPRQRQRLDSRYALLQTTHSTKSDSDLTRFALLREHILVGEHILRREHILVVSDLE